MLDNYFSNTISLFIFRPYIRGMLYGIGTYIQELTQSLLQFSNINIFLVSYMNPDYKEFYVKRVHERIQEINIPKPFYSITQNDSFEKKYADSVVRLLMNLIPKNGYVVFQFNYLDDLPIIIKLKKCFDFPIISMVHFAQWQEIFEGNKNKLSGLNIDKPSNNIEYTLSREREMYRLSDHIVSVTQYMNDFLVNEYAIHQEKINVIRNGLDINKCITISQEERNGLRKKLGFSGEDEIIILFSGRIDSCKGVLYLMEAFEEACKKNSNLRLVLLGQGNIQDCQKKLHSLFGKVTYTGFLPKAIVNSFYLSADIGIVPSVYDHCPYAVLEMMANKIPLIVSRIKGLDELLSDKQCLFVNPIINSNGDITFSVKELSESILMLAENKNLRKMLARNSYRNFTRKFSALRMAEEMNGLFHSLLRKKGMTFTYEKNERRQYSRNNSESC